MVDRPTRRQPLAALWLLLAFLWVSPARGDYSIVDGDFDIDSSKYSAFSAGKGEKGLFPSIFNLATHADIRATATCGQHGPEHYCKLVEHVFGRAPQCDICDANDHHKNHPIDFAIDGTPKWWQSPSLANGLTYEKVNVTLDLRQEYQVAYVIVKAGNAPRPGTWVLEKSLDGITYTPWQYYAMSEIDCMRHFGVPASTGVPRFTHDDEVTCTSFFSRLDPIENGEIHTSLVNHRPSAEHPSKTLQNFTRARFVRLRLLTPRTLNADLIYVNRKDKKLDQSVTRRYFYSIKDISIGGQCICSGHAESCPPEEVHGQFRCECRHNTCGETCNECCDLFNQLPWQPGTHKNPNVCQPCQCFNHATKCVYDESVVGRSLTPDGLFEGGGRCLDCAHNTEGVNCEKCQAGFYRPSNVSHYLHNACIPCDCDPLGSESNECVRDDTVAFDDHKPGNCICKPGFGGRRCEKCARGFRNYPVCERCPCHQAGSLNFDTCEEESCICKANVEGKYCDQCKLGTIFLNPHNPQGCQPCFCFGKSTICEEGNWAVDKLSATSSWNLTEFHNFNVNVEPKKDAQNVSTLLSFTATEYERESSLSYWKAPTPFSGDLLNSYGGDLHYFVYFVPTRVEAVPTPFPDVIIEGNGIRLEHYTRLNFFPRENISVTVPFSETNGWYNSATRQPIDKADLMRVLSDVKYFLVRARYTSEQLQSSIYGLTLETATPSTALSAGGNDTVYKFNEIKMNGVEICECPENFVGNSCERCESGYRRVSNQLYDGRCEKCSCDGHSNECDPFTGACVNCKHNTTGARCEQCLPGHYGNPLLGGELGACKQCACPTIDNNHSSQCALAQLVLEGAAAADQDEYVCTACEPGYDGNKCEVCADGYFGEPAAINGTCQACSCNGNIDPAAIGNCDRTTGDCLRCIGYTDGASCERCADNHWGSALDHTCKPCGCHHVGAIDLQCSNTTGFCECKEHYLGAHCESCAPGHGDVDSGCPACDCDEIGAIGTECNQVTGQCQCKVGVYGKRCDLCIPSYYNFTEQGCTFCHCDNYGSIDQKCSNTTGACECRSNVEGTRCDHCVPGYFNITSNVGCEACNCNELGSTTNECNLITGQCVCKPGVTGIKCDTCLPNHWGLNETGCSECQKCPSPGQVCDPVNGECVCPPNTIGEACESCAPNSWNYNAYTGCVRCDCDGVGADSAECDAVTGQCKCKSGFVGHKCDRCEVGYFNFPDCEPCNCSPDGTDPRECRDNQCLCTNEGQCKCKPHVTGLKCDQCSANSFALDAHNELGCTECFCFNRTNFCVQNSLVWQQIYANDRRALFDEPYEKLERRGNLQVLQEQPQNLNSYLINSVPMYWPLPRNFLGDRTGSYNGFLRFKIWSEDNYRRQHGILPTPTTFKMFPQIILIGNDRLTLEHTAEEISVDNKYKVRLHEKSWRNKVAPQIPVTRAQLMVALQNIQAIYIRGTYNEFYRQDAINLKDVSLDVAVENVTDNASQSTAVGVELCGECPEGYAGASCQNPADGYCRKRAPSYLNDPDDIALIGFSSPCACNGHSVSCDPESCRCNECAHNTVGDFCERCKPGYHGDATSGIRDACVKCACPLASNSFSDTCSSSDTGRGYVCDACRPGYIGQYCEACVQGYFGDPTVDGGFCDQCACHPFGSLHGVCHNVTGQCECRNGVTGRDCSVCSPRHAFINQVCTSCDQGCYSALMRLEDELEADLATVKNLTEATPIPHKRLRKINAAVDSFNGILEGIKLSEASAADLIGPDTKAENRNIKEALVVIEEAKVLRERADDALERLAGLQQDLQAIRDVEHTQNRRVHEIATQLNAFAEHVTNTHSAGNVEYLVTQAEEYLEAIKERDRAIEKQLNYANKNAEEAEALLTKVLAKKLNESSYKELSEQYKEKFALLKAFRDTIWDDAKVNSTAARKLTEVVNSRLEQLKDTVAEIEKAAAEQKDTHAKTEESIEAIKQELLNSHDYYKDISDNLLDTIKAASANARAKTEKDIETLHENKHKAVKAEQHAKDLNHAAKKLKLQIDSTKSVSTEALAATNAYKDIVEALVNASNAATKAKTDAENAFSQIGQDTDDSIVDLAAAKLNGSKQLQENFANADGSDVADATVKLRAVLDRVQRAAKEIQDEAKKVKDSQSVLDDHEDRINNIHVTVATAKDVSDSAGSSVDNFVKDVDELAHQVAGATNFNEQAIADDIANVTKTSADLAASLNKLNAVSERSAGHVDELRSVKEKLNVLREKLNEAKEKASKVRISVSSDPRRACSRAYLSPAHPSPTNTINLRYRPAIDVSDSLLFLTLTKSRRTAAREFLAIELRDRRIIVHWNIGSGSRRATNSHNIAYIPASDRYTWYHIDVTRIGNAVRVAVGQKQTLGGEGPKNVDEPTEAVLGEPDVTSDVVLNTIPGETKIHVGHDDSDLATELGLGTNKFTGVLGELSIDGSAIPLWVFASQSGQCDGAVGAPVTAARGHFFRNGFAQIRMPMSERLNTLIRIVYSAYSPDGLLYFRGSPTSGDFVSIELREGAIWVKARIGEESNVEVHSALASYADGRVHTIKITKKAAEIELSVDEDADREAIAIPGAGTSPAQIGDEDPHFVGGVALDFDKSAFKTRDINWVGFVGCIQLVKPNQVSELDLDHPIRSQRVQPGCTFKADRLLPIDRVIGFPKPGYLVTESVKLDSNSSLSFNLRTTNGNAVLLYQKALKSASKRDADSEDPTFFAFYLYNGRLIVHLGTDVSDRLKRPSLSSNYTYNDGRLHNVFLARTASSIEIRIDDREVLKSHFGDETVIGSTDAKLYFGGLPTRLRSPNDNDDIGTTESLIGCLSDFYFNFERWSIIPEEHQALLGTCTLDDKFDVETASEESGEAPQGFERKNSKISLALAAPTYVSDDAKAITEYDLVSTPPSTCKAVVPLNSSTLVSSNGVRYGASESSNSRIGFSKPRPDFKNFNIEFNFKTDTADGMIWVWANYKNYTRYFLLYLDEGFLTLAADNARGRQKLYQYKERRFDDDEWHFVDFRKQEHEVRLQVDNLAAATFKDVPHARVTVKRMYVGGVISRHKKLFAFPKANFKGCIRDFFVDGQIQDLVESSRDLIPCKETIGIAYIHSGGFASFSGLKSYKTEASDTNAIEIQFRFRSINMTGILVALASQSDESARLFVSIDKTHLIFKAYDNIRDVSLEHRVPLPTVLCASEWHRFHFTLTSERLILRLDDTQSTQRLSDFATTTIDAFRALPVNIGGVSANIAASAQLYSLTGCYHDIQLGRIPAPIDKANRKHKVIENGCPLA